MVSTLETHLRNTRLSNVNNSPQTKLSNLTAKNGKPVRSNMSNSLVSSLHPTSSLPGLDVDLLLPLLGDLLPYLDRDGAGELKVWRVPGAGLGRLPVPILVKVPVPARVAPHPNTFPLSPGSAINQG